MVQENAEERQLKSAPFANLPPPPQAANQSLVAPDDASCFSLWDKYAMLDNIRRHSLMVACISGGLAERAKELGISIDIDACRASGLLHDIAKTWCLKYGGANAMLGASLVVQETRNYAVAQGVLLHVHWPWPLPEGDAICCLPLFVLYADKRVRHDQYVTLDERFDDLVARYGKSADAREHIRRSWQQAQNIEAALSKQLKWNLNEDSFDRWRLVE